MRYLILLLSAFSAAAGSVTLAWNHSTSYGVVLYTVYYRTNDAPYVDRVTVPASTNRVTLEGIDDCRTYQFVCTASNGYGSESEYSNQVEYVSPCAAPELPQLTTGTFLVITVLEEACDPAGPWEPIGTNMVMSVPIEQGKFYRSTLTIKHQ